MVSRAFRDVAASSGLPLSYVVLRPDQDTAVRRAVGRRDPGGLTDPGPVRQLHAQFADLGQHALDTTSLDAVATAAVVGRGLADGTFLLTS